MAKLECPICGKSYREEEMQISDNGNLVCYHCAQKENADDSTEEDN